MLKARVGEDFSSASSAAYTRSASELAIASSTYLSTGIAEAIAATGKLLTRTVTGTKGFAVAAVIAGVAVQMRRALHHHASRAFGAFNKYQPNTRRLFGNGLVFFCKLCANCFAIPAPPRGFETTVASRNRAGGK
jgi:hypothetical protein